MRPGLCVVLFSFLAGCASGGNGGTELLEIVCITSHDQQCAVSTDEANCIEKGLLDLDHPLFAGAPSYYLFPILHNKSDNTVLTIKKFTISYQWLEGRDTLKDYYPSLQMLEEGEFDVYFGLSIDLDDKAQTDIRAIHPDVGNSLTLLSTDAEEFVLGVNLTAKAETPDGAAITSNTILFPIELCWGCLSETCPDGTYPACMPGQNGNNLSCE
jgi:hypothetical protein